MPTSVAAIASRPLKPAAADTPTPSLTLLDSMESRTPGIHD